MLEGLILPGREETAYVLSKHLTYVGFLQVLINGYRTRRALGKHNNGLSGVRALHILVALLYIAN